MKKFIYHSAQWCGPCKTFGPIMERVSQSGIPVEKIDVDQSPATAARYNVRSVPTTILVNEGGQEISRFVGVKTESQVRELYNQN